jgi:hypothetical protein
MFFLAAQGTCVSLIIYHAVSLPMCSLIAPVRGFHVMRLHHSQAPGCVCGVGGGLSSSGSTAFDLYSPHLVGELLRNLAPGPLLDRLVLVQPRGRSRVVAAQLDVHLKKQNETTRSTSQLQGLKPGHMHAICVPGTLRANSQFNPALCFARASAAALFLASMAANVS